MNKKLFILLFSIFLTTRLIAQPPDAIIKKYINDTSGFTAYPDTFLLDNIKPAQHYTHIEINTWASAYRIKGDNRPRYDYKNLCRYPASAKKLPDTIVLTKCELSKCFTACWCPSFYPWYISAQTKNNRLETVGDTSAMKTFLGNTKNKFNAFLWLSLHDMHEGEPLKSSHFFKYKKVKGGFLIRYNSRTENAPVTTADLTYFVGNDFKIVLISKKHVVVNKGMFI